MASEDALPAAVRARGCGEGGCARRGGAEWKYTYTAGQTAYAWTPVGDPDPLLRALGHARLEDEAQQPLRRASRSTRRVLGSPLKGTLSLPAWDMPSLHNKVQRTPPVVAATPKPEAAQFTSTGSRRPGRASSSRRCSPASCSRSGAAQWREAIVRTARAHEDPGARHRAGARARVPDPLLGHRRGPRPRVHQRRRRVSVLRRLPGLARRVPDGLRHGVATPSSAASSASPRSSST